MKELQSVLITGASSGLGRSLATEYASDGVTLFLSGRNWQRLEETAGKCREKGAKVLSEAMDITDAAAVEKWVYACDDFCPVDLVIANAGVSGGTGGGGETTAQVKNIFATNVNGVIHTIHPLIPLMKKRLRGQIAIVSSLASYRGLPGAPAYSASKMAIRGYGEALRGRLHRYGVGVTVITPGYIRTPMTKVNDFPMPMLMDAEKAAHIIAKRLKKNPARIAFPFPLYFAVWLLGCLPPWLTDPMLRKLPEKPRQSSK